MDEFEFLSLLNTLAVDELNRRPRKTNPTPEDVERMKTVQRRLWAQLETLGRQRRQNRAPVVFELAGRVCLLDGEPILRRHAKALSLAWVVLAAEQYRLGAVRPEWVYDGAHADRSAVSRIRAVADQVERKSLTLASALRSIGIDRGYLVSKGNANAILCTSPALAACNS